MTTTDLPPAEPSPPAGTSERAPGAPPVPPSPELSHREILLVFSGLMAGMLMAALDGSILATAMPTIVGDLGGLDQLSWVFTAYLLTTTVATPLYGKLSDLYGRKLLFQAAIVIFLIGSLLCGLSQSMTQLVMFRGIQGIGGGGLMAMAFATIADVVPPRERGRYTGYLGSVFAFSSVVGPFIGGYFVDNLSWRWVFYINLPVGIAALFITSAVLKLPVVRREHRIDWVGAAVLIVGVTAFLLGLVWGGAKYAWASPTIVGLFASAARLPRHLHPVGVPGGGAAAPPAAVLRPGVHRGVGPRPPRRRGDVRRHRLPSPLPPGGHRRQRHQLRPAAPPAHGGPHEHVDHLGPHHHPDRPLPSVAHRRHGHRQPRHVPALHHERGRQPPRRARPTCCSSGVGLGMVMQVLILAAQNSADFRDLGVVTSGVNFFRSLGGSIGVAVFGAIMTARLTPALADRLPGSAGSIDTGSLVNSPEAIAALPAEIGDAVVSALAVAIDTVFLWATPLLLIGFVLAWFLPEKPLRTTTQASTALPPE